jgi:PAS domain S-box-containing protein
MNADHELLRSLCKADFRVTLGYGVYLDLKDGTLVECNREMRSMLELPQDGPLRASMTEFYKDPKERATAMAAADRLKDGTPFVSRATAFVVSDRTKWFQTSCLALRSPDREEVLGYVGYVLDVTEEESFRELVDELPAGVYRLDKDDKVIRVNRALVKYLGYSSDRELIGRDVEELYADPATARAFRKRVISERRVTNEKVELRKPNDERIYASSSCRAILAPDGTYIGREGTLTDVTEEELYRRLLNEIPVGMYTVRRDLQGRDIIRQCNAAFAKMFAFPTPDAACDRDIRELFWNPVRDYAPFVSEMMREHRRQRPLLGHELEARTALGKRIVIEVNSQLITDMQGNVLGRTGVVRDITNEIGLRRLRDDVGGVLHAQIGTFMMLSHSLLLMAEVIGRGVLSIENAPDVMHSWTQLAGPTHDLRDCAKVASDSLRRHDSATELAESLSLQIENLSDAEGRVDTPENLIPYLCSVSNEIAAICARPEVASLCPLESEVARVAAERLERVCCILDLRRIHAALLEIHRAIRCLCESLIRQGRPLEERVRISWGTLFSRAVSNLQAYARSRHLEIRLGNRAVTELLAEPRGVQRAIEDVLHNAIKYSWDRSPHGDRWVSVSSKVTDKSIALTIENLGVPITRTEIEDELVFEAGYRGRYSADRGRPGTGFGLADALTVVRRHGGIITVESTPATPGQRRDDYSGPFLTRVMLTFSLEEGGV